MRTYNKCIGDDTKAAARESLNCINTKKEIKYGEKRFSIWRMELLHPAMWHLTLESLQWIHQVAAPCNVIRGSGMTCHWVRPNVRHYWNSTPGFDFDHIATVDMSFCTSLRKFIQIGTPSAEKMTSCRFSTWRISAILDFRDPIMGCLKLHNFQWVDNRHHSSKLLSFLENRVFAFWRQHPRWRISAILDFRGPIIYSFVEKPMYDFL